MARRTVSVRVEAEVDMLGADEPLRTRLAELAAEAVAADPWVVEVLHAATVVRRNG